MGLSRYPNPHAAIQDMNNLVKRYHRKKYERVLEFEAKIIREQYAVAREYIMKETTEAREILSQFPKKMRLTVI